LSVAANQILATGLYTHTMNLADEFATYHDLARKLKLERKTISRLVLRLEKANLIKPWRPNRNTVRLSPADVQILLVQHSL
jgi:DNA-binding MarR family transcriptional regulator